MLWEQRLISYERPREEVEPSTMMLWEQRLISYERPREEVQPSMMMLWEQRLISYERPREEVEPSMMMGLQTSWCNGISCRQTTKNCPYGRKHWKYRIECCKSCNFWAVKIFKWNFQALLIVEKCFPCKIAFCLVWHFLSRMTEI